MPRTQARIHTSVWVDDDFIGLPAGAQRVYFLAFSQANINTCGVVSYTPRRWAKLASDTTARGVARDVSVLVDRGKVLVDEVTEELWVRGFLKYDGILKSDNMTIAMSREFPSIMSRSIRDALLERLGEGFLEGLGERVREGLGQPFVEAFHERFKEPLGERPLAGALRAHGADSPSPSPSPSPPGGGTVPDTGGAQTNGSPGNESGDFNEETLGLAEWYLGALDPGGTWSERRRAKALADSRRVISWAQQALDDRPIEEAIGRCREASERPTSVKYLETALRRVAAENDVELPELGS